MGLTDDREEAASDSSAELIEDFMRVVQEGDEYCLQVGIVQWQGPHTPDFVWKTARRWKCAPTIERLAAAQRAALRTPRFFRVCGQCRERENAGHMDGDNCHACMARMGVVF